MSRNTDDIQLSNVLSWLLRQGAPSEGLPISEDGYIEMDKILVHHSINGKFTKSDIERVVATNNKQRFKLRVNHNTKKQEIKAAHGHTMKSVSDSELDPVSEASSSLSDLTIEAPATSAPAESAPVASVPVASAPAATAPAESAPAASTPAASTPAASTPAASAPAASAPAASAESMAFQHRLRVTGFPVHTQAPDLVRVFKQFGHMKVEKMKKRAGGAIVAFENKADAETAARCQTVNVYGSLLKVVTCNKPNPETQNQAKKPKKRLSKKNRGCAFPLSTEKDTIIDPKSIDLKGDFENQLQKLLASIRLTREEVMALDSLYSDLMMTLQQLWPGCKAMPFGSITTGLGIKTSDADCYIDIPENYRSLDARYVKRAARLLEKYPKIYSEIFSIPNANTPIVKFFHVPTKTKCDVSFKAPLGYYNSQLTAFLISCDPRIISMSIVIKYWAKVHGLTGTGRLSNYTLTMMIIFYLQQAPLNILPPVHWLQSDPEYTVVTGCWNTGFMNKQYCMPASSNSASIAELLGGFFNYYSVFEFHRHAVCPFLGKAMEKSDFVNLHKLPNEYALYKKNVEEMLSLPLKITTAMCVQDPFEQCYNIAGCVSDKLAADLKKYFQLAATTYDAEATAGLKNFLTIILTTKLKKPAPIHSVITVNRKIIEAIPNDIWSTELHSAILTIFEDILQMQINFCDEIHDTKQGIVKIRFAVQLNSAIWKRPEFETMFMSEKMPYIDKQISITSAFLKKTTDSMRIKFRLGMKYDLNNKIASIQMSQYDGCPEAYMKMYDYLNFNLNIWVMRILDIKGVEINSDQDSDINKSTDDLKENISSSDEESDDSKNDDETLDVSEKEADSPDIAIFKSIFVNSNLLISDVGNVAGGDNALS